MATRCYFPHDTAAPVTAPNPGSEWEHIQDSPGGRQRKLLFHAASATTLTTEAYTPDAADHLTNQDAYHRTYVSDPIAAQTISGNLSGQFQISEQFNNCNLFLTLKVYVVSNNGVTVRSPVALAITRDTTNEAATALTNRNFPSTALSSVTASEGDRLVVEVGLGGNITSGTGGAIGHNGSIRWGDNASGGDLPANDSETGTTLRPWIEFATTIKVRGETDGSVPITAAVTGAAATLLPTIGSGSVTTALAADTQTVTVVGADGSLVITTALAADGEDGASGPIEADGTISAVTSLPGVGAAVWATSQDLAALTTMTGISGATWGTAPTLAATTTCTALSSALWSVAANATATATVTGVSGATYASVGSVAALAVLTGAGENAAAPPPAGGGPSLSQSSRARRATFVRGRPR